MFVHTVPFSTRRTTQTAAVCASQTAAVCASQAEYLDLKSQEVTDGLRKIAEWEASQSILCIIVIPTTHQNIIWEIQPCFIEHVCTK